MKLTRQQAIREKCKDCIYDPLAGGTWMQQVENCEVVACPLHEYRPVTEKTRQARRQIEIDAMNSTELAAYRDRQDKARKTLAKNIKPI